MLPIFFLLATSRRPPPFIDLARKPNDPRKWIGRKSVSSLQETAESGPVVLNVTIAREAKTCITRCAEIGVASQGGSPSEAVFNLWEAIGLFAKGEDVSTADLRPSEAGVWQMKDGVSVRSIQWQLIDFEKSCIFKVAGWTISEAIQILLVALEEEFSEDVTARCRADRRERSIREQLAAFKNQPGNLAVCSPDGSTGILHGSGQRVRYVRVIPAGGGVSWYDWRVTLLPCGGIWREDGGRCWSAARSDG